MIPTIYWIVTKPRSEPLTAVELGARPVEQTFSADSAILLEQPEEHPIGRLGGVLVVRGQLLATDMLVGEVRIYSLMGQLLRTIGRPGDGPGEFRAPSHLFPMPSGGFAVYDMQHDAISAFDSTGAFVRRWNTRVTRIGSTPVAVAGKGIVVPGRSESEYEAKPGALVSRLHLVSDSGAVVRSFGMFPAPRNAEEDLMSQTLLARVGRHFVAMQSTDPTVYIFSNDGEVLSMKSAATQFYSPPAWPANGFSGSDAMRQFQEWHNDQMKATAIIPLDERRFAIAFTHPGGKQRVPSQHLVVMDVAGDLHFVTSPSTRIHRALGEGRIGSVQQRDDGLVTLQMLRLNEVPLTPESAG